MTKGTLPLADLLRDVRVALPKGVTEGTLRHRSISALEAFLESSGLRNLEVQAKLEERILHGRSDARHAGKPNR